MSSLNLHSNLYFEETTKLQPSLNILSATAEQDHDSGQGGSFCCLAPSAKSELLVTSKLPDLDLLLAGIEEMHYPNAGADELTKHDVICGRSKAAFANIGNHHFRVTISLYTDEYIKNTSRCDRSRLIQMIMDLIRYDCGGRFLKTYHDGAWVELDEPAIRNKVAHALRDTAAANTSKIPKTRTHKKLLLTRKKRQQQEERMVDAFDDEPQKAVQCGFNDGPLDCGSYFLSWELKKDEEQKTIVTDPGNSFATIADDWSETGMVTEV